MSMQQYRSSTERPIYAGESHVGLYTALATTALVADVSVTAWGALALSGAHPHMPLTVLLALAFGRERWSAAASGWAAALAAVQLVVLVWVVRRWWRRIRSGEGGRARRFDFASQWMAGVAEVASLRGIAGLETAHRLSGVAWPGVPLGVLVTPNGTPDYEEVKTELDPAAMLYSDCESLSIDIWGPRRGKTTSRVIPAILEAPGAVMVTSNKRDVVDATRGVREQLSGGEVFVFDPQRIVGGEPQFWWDPIKAITMDDREVWPERAEKLADIFLAATTPPRSNPDPFFDPEGRDLLARLLLAAAVGEESIVRVYDWITSPTPKPLAYLQGSEFSAAARALEKFIGYSQRQKDGLFGTAKKMTNILSRPSVQKWVSPTPGRAEFDPIEFVTSTSTLYILSKEGADSAGALATALTWATCDAAERHGNANGGRLPVPMLAALDELANVIKWPDLPGKYSHYGSRGIVMMAVLQNWSQGINCFGEEGIQQLWDAATFRYYGGGVADDKILEKLSKLIGSRWEIATATNQSRPNELFGASGGGHVSVSRDTREYPILSVAHLSQLPRGRAVVLWGDKPVMVRPVPYWDRPYAAAVAASLATYDPGAKSKKDPAVAGTLRRGWMRLLPGRAPAAAPELVVAKRPIAALLAAQSKAEDVLP